MDPQQLRERAKKARDESSREKFQLFESVLQSYTAQAEDKLYARIQTAHEEFEKRAHSAAARGRDDAVLVRLSSQLYDLRQAALEEFSLAATRNPDPYPQLRKQGPFAFRDFDRWVRVDLQWVDCEHTSPLAWLDDLARWLQKRSGAGALGKLLQGGPPLKSPLLELYAACKERGLKPHFEFYSQIEDKGIALKVSWSG
jgi:hypothetical protein